jgi:hypothetical protein
MGVSIKSAGCCLVLAGLIILLFFPAAATASEWWIIIDPVAVQQCGESTLEITGSTNLPAGDELLIEIISSTFSPTAKTSGGEFSGASGIIYVMQGVQGENWWTFEVDSAGLPEESYRVHIESIAHETTADSGLSKNVMTCPITITLSGVIYIKTIPSGADLFVNGKYEGLTGEGFSKVTVDPGECQIRVEKAGYLIYSESFTAIPDLQKTVTLEKIITQGTQMPESYIYIMTDPPGAELFVNGEYIGKTGSDYTKVTVFQKECEINVEKNGYFPYTESFTVIPNMQKTVYLNEFSVTSAPQPIADISIMTYPSGADVYLNGRWLCFSGDTPKKVTVDRKECQIRVEKPGYKTYTETFTAYQDMELVISLEKNQDSPLDNGPTVTVTGLPGFTYIAAFIAFCACYAMIGRKE